MSGYYKSGRVPSSQDPRLRRLASQGNMQANQDQEYVLQGPVRIKSNSAQCLLVDRTNQVRPADIAECLSLKETNSWTGEAANKYGVDATFLDSTVITSSDYDRTYGAYFDTAKNGSNASSQHSYAYGLVSRVYDSATYTYSGIGQTLIDNYAIQAIVLATATINVGAGKYATHTTHGVKIDSSTSYTVTSGSLTVSQSGLTITGSGTPTGSGVIDSVSYAILNQLGKTTKSAVRWCMYNDTDAGNWMGEDAAITYFGTGKDASIQYDGTDFYITTNEVAASDLHVTTGAAKTLVLDTPVYDDCIVYAAGVKLHGTAYPAWVDYRGGQVLAFSKSAINQVYFNQQLPHTYKEGTDVEFHIHIAYPDDTTGNSVWYFTYSWANINEPFPTESNSGNVTVAAPGTGASDNHEFAELVATISGTGKTVSSYLICSLSRLGNHGDDNYDNVILFLGADFHHQKDSLGSRMPTTK